MTDEAIPELDFTPCPLNWNHNDMMLLDKGMIGEVFHILAREDYAPVYLHCNIGTDRTGMITFLLGTLCGMHLEDLYRDYLFSNFSTIQGSRDLSAITNKYQKDLEAYHQDNLYYDTRAYLTECGLDDEELDRIVERFVDFDVE
ncbi:MAG: tyrosine-protein phosphatase [Bacilli bacterium]|nr:tyrosine-protein phosphatase [Bacilli bacterium]